ncbi:MAG: trypsin-like serine protease [Myxococcaceae bacterium]
MKFDSILSFCSAALLSLSACGPGSLDQSFDQDVGAADQEVIGGVLANDFPQGVLIQWPQGPNTNGVCTGSLVAPRVVVTAGHCVGGASNWIVRAPYAGNTDVQTVAGHVTDYVDGGNGKRNPAIHDLGILILASPVQLNSYARIQQTPLANGTSVTLVGRDEDARVSMTDLYKASVTVTDGTSLGFPFDYQSTSVLRGGDSGGPVYKDGTRDLVAVNSAGDLNIQVLARVDLQHEWILRFIAHPDAANCYVKGAILDKYRELGGLQSPLGDCVSNELPIRDGIGRASHFQRGSIYWTPATGAHNIQGAIREKYMSMGWETSALGYPITDEHDVPGGRRNTFQHGSITWNRATGVVDVAVTP